ncbi:MAG: glycoside hydrolase family 130 protein [Planctomycetaceae bacterium]|nr:glycoside hydrolase family 130 protein [Planctomycetaceae bacterium]
MAVERLAENPILTPKDVPPSRPDFEVVGAFNPAAVLYGDEVLLLLRVAERPRDKKPDEQAAPILNPDSGQIEYFRVKNDDPNITDIPDSRSFYYEGKMFLTSISHLRLARSRDGIHFKVDPKPAVFPKESYETFGLEDPRITPIAGICYISYKVVSQNGICTGLLTTKDFKRYERHGIIFCPENIDVVLFPDKIGGKYWALTRPVPRYLGPRGIWIASSPDALHWGRHQPLVLPRPELFDGGKTGGGCVPIRTPQGWLEIYHGSDKEDRYSLAAALLDLENPTRVLARSSKPLMEPAADYELRGFYGNVVFACGHVEKDGLLWIYYGAADEYTACARMTLEDIFATFE